MATANLRIFRGEPDQAAPIDSAGPGEAKVSARLGDLLPLLADAVSCNRTWLQDFADDEVAISSDLYEVLMAYRFFRRNGG